ncbi:MAG: hypothetical protein MK082_11250 [Phycisphaerales bacterium]|nr:hypothetical protein [Phycisphaerales bacterium]
MTKGDSSGSSYKLGRFIGTCAATDRTLEPGTECIACLCEPGEAEIADGALGLVRREYCLEAWESGSRPQGLFSWWRTRMPEPDAPRRVLVDDDALLDLFDRLGSEDDDRRRGFRWVLGLILVRKKLLRLEGSARTEEGDVFLLRRRGTDPALPPIEMLDPKLEEDDARKIADELGEIMASDD